MKPTPTDLELLNAIHERYYDVFVSYDNQKPNRDSKIYVPIDINEIGKQLRIDSDIVFGRLYYHLNERYKYKQDGGGEVHFFSIRVGGDSHCVNFPYLASALAQLRDEDRKYRLATTIAIVSLFVSVVSLGIALLR